MQMVKSLQFKPLTPSLLFTPGIPTFPFCIRSRTEFGIHSIIDPVLQSQPSRGPWKRVGGGDIEHTASFQKGACHLPSRHSEKHSVMGLGLFYHPHPHSATPHQARYTRGY